MYSEHAYRTGQFGGWLSPIRSKATCRSYEQTPHIIPIGNTQLGFDLQWFGMEISAVTILTALIVLAKKCPPSSARFKPSRRKVVTVLSVGLVLFIAAIAVITIRRLLLGS